MGTFTPIFKLFKPDPTDTVDVESQVNNNYDIADVEFRSLMEYIYFTGSSVTDAAIPKKLDYKWYKSYNNGVAFWRKYPDNHIALSQDVKSFVTGWNDVTPYFAAAFTGVGQRFHVDWPYARIVTRSAGLSDVTLSGKMTRVNGAEIALNTIITMFTLPAAYWPLVDKVFTCLAGGSTNYSISRVTVSTAGVVSLYRMGDASTFAASERYIDLDGISYSTEVAA